MYTSGFNKDLISKQPMFVKLQRFLSDKESEVTTTFSILDETAGL